MKNLSLFTIIDGNETSHVLQHKAFIKLFRLINKQLDTAKNFTLPEKNALSFDRPHQAILIEGGRGSGKTTFLLDALHALNGRTRFDGGINGPHELPKSIQDELNDKQNGGRCKEPSTIRRIHVLPIIDPTLIETKEHILVVIISMIDKILDKYCYNDRGNDLDYQEVDTAREEMAEGLKLLDGIGKSNPYGEEAWEDPIWVMSTGLRQAQKGASFEIAFQKYIFSALKALKKEAFVLAFDDVDTNFRHGYVVLETIRKYLTSPQLILIISGDLDLYGRLVRNNIYKKLGSEVLKYDDTVMLQEPTESTHSTKTTTNLSKAVRELEEQYLLKIIPPQNRVAMLPLSGLIQQEGDKRKNNQIRISLSKDEKENSESLTKWISKKINELLLDEGGPTPHPFSEIISREHLRLVIDYLDALADDNRTAARQAVHAVFEARLRYAGIDALHLAYTTAEDIRFIVFRWLSEQNDPARLSLFGVPSNPDKAIVLHCLALALAQSISKSPYDNLRTLLTVNLPLQMMQRGNYTNPSVRTAMTSFLWSETNTNLIEIAARIGSIARLKIDGPDKKSSSIGTERASCFGSVGVSRSPNRQKLLHLMFGLDRDSISMPRIRLVDLIGPKNKTGHKGKNSPYLSSLWPLFVINEIMEKRTGRSLSRYAQENTAWFTIDELINRTGHFGNILNLIYYRRYTPEGAQYGSVSALSLFSAIIELLQKDCNDIENFLSNNSSLDVVPAFIPDNQNKITGSSIEQEEEEYNDDGNNTQNDDNEEHYTNFLNKIETWVKITRSYLELSTEDEENNNTWAGQLKNHRISPSMLGRLANRIHEALVSLDDEVARTTKWPTGLILHRQITNVLHALITFNKQHHRLESPKTSDAILIKALNQTHSETQESTVKHSSSLHPLAAAIISCPLIWAFLGWSPFTSDPNTQEELSIFTNTKKELIRSGNEYIFEELPPMFSPFETLREAARKSMDAFIKDYGTDSSSKNIEDLFTPPMFNIKIGRNSATIEQKGFFTLLNVVPRYYHNNSN